MSLTRRRAWLVAAGVGAVLGCVLLYRTDPAQSRLFPICPFHWLTGLQCPGCGTTRALHHLLHGELGLALRYNLLTMLALPLVVAAGLRWAWRAWHDLPPQPLLRGSGWVWWAVALLVVWWVLRNLPWYPWTLLAPPA